MSHGAKTELFVRKQSGGMFTVVDEGMTTGNIYFVDSGKTTTGGDTAPFGDNPDHPFLTLDYAITQTTAANNDRIYVMAGHTESIVSASDIAFGTKTGVHVIGLGHGADRPVFTFDTDIAATIAVNAASTKLENLVFVNGLDNMTSPMLVTAADCEFIDVETRDNNSSYHCDDFIKLSNAAHRFHMKGWRHLAGDGKTGAQSALYIDGSDDIFVEDFYCLGEFAVANIDNTTGADEMLRCVFKHGLLENTAIQPCLDADTDATGYFYDVHMRIASGTTYINGDPDIQFIECYGSNAAGGGQEEIGSIISGSVEGKIDVIDGYHDVAAVDTSDNLVISDTVGNKDDTAATTGSVIAMEKGIIAAIGVVDAFHDVPLVDTSDNVVVSDVLGNKNDTAATTGSVIAIEKGIVAAIGVVDAFHDIPTVDTSDNVVISDVLGNKDDTAATTGSVVAINKGIVAAVGVVDAFHDVPTVNTSDNVVMSDVLGNKDDSATSTGSVAAIIKQIFADSEGSTINKDREQYLMVTADFSQTTWNALTSHEILTVTGLNRVRIIPEVQADVGNDSATAKLSLGTANTVAEFLAATTATELDAGEIWQSTTGASNVSSLAHTSLVDYFINDDDIGYLIATTATTAGSMRFHCWWEALEDGASVAAGTGVALR